MTEERLEKIERVLLQRQYGLGVVLENVEDPHNIAAVLRTCDAAGVQDVYIIDSKHKLKDNIGWKSSRSATKWMTVHAFNNIQDCIAELRKRFDIILATHLSTDSRSVYATDLTANTALLFGNEIKGLSEEIMRFADGKINIPQYGMLHSLNISVACAVTIFEAVRQRSAKGMFEKQSMPAEMYAALHKEWTSKKRSIGE